VLARRSEEVWGESLRALVESACRCYAVACSLWLCAALVVFGPSSLTAPEVARAATNVSGTISTGTTCDLPRSPFVVVGDVTVAAGATLTIEAGMIVKFNAPTRTLRVNGTLNAVGSAGSRIVFTSNHDDVGGDTDGQSVTPAAGNWNQIRFSATTGSSTLRFVDVRYGGWGLSGSATTSSGAVHVAGGGSVLIEDSTIEDNQSSRRTGGDPVGHVSRRDRRRSCDSRREAARALPARAHNALWPNRTTRELRSRDNASVDSVDMGLDRRSALTRQSVAAASL